LERVAGATDLESRKCDIAIIWGGKKFEREFMCDILKGVNQHVRGLGARTCRHRGLRARAWWGTWEAHGCGSL